MTSALYPSAPTWESDRRDPGRRTFRSVDAPQLSVSGDSPAASSARRFSVVPPLPETARA
ncbi:MAG: hypothetical protein K0S37_143 [Microbacterium sp.]|jgi:hypothetical protein|nr:hypothetical protein [Microbacterium sp.]